MCVASALVQVEESLGEAVVELRGKKREMEQMKARVDGLLMALQSGGGGGGGGGGPRRLQ